ncbi:DUF3025 domain-containing protein [Pseudoalteromonas sp. S4498]|uniref:DUF3025 domain-containing protein n=1 Tax=Pseudoalteromonas galatheae TaxID=579562 RepID=UPI001108A413|nr:DUF3025 domain-containing protein [Pseudoalteromonas galatheae]NKC18738.1 DUF3025 domain-containing protein [Pseudoalteromonas galatheae]
MKKFTAPEAWQVACLHAEPFSHLNQLFDLKSQQDWPSPQWLSSHVNSISLQQYDTRFVADETIDFGDKYYEEIIFETHQVPTRSQNWHDLFGALIWCLFPKTKALLNALHIEEIAQFGLKQRSKKRNALTLFDECGLVLAIDDDKWRDAFKSHQWQNVFYDNRSEWQQNLKPFVFGHANYEMLTNPFIGLTGKLVCINVDAAFWQLSLSEQYRCLDDKLVALINDGLLEDNTKMSPIPLLGIPNWHEPQDLEFYQNTDYFRPKRRK